MIKIVPVPELALNVKPGQRIEADSELYAYFRDQLFLDPFTQKLPKNLKSEVLNSGKNLFESFEDASKFASLLASFDKKRKKIIKFQEVYFGYDVNDLGWCGIDLYQFEDEEECLEYFGKNTKGFKFWKSILPSSNWRIDVK